MKKIIFFLGLIISTSAFSQTKSTDLIGSDSLKINWELYADLVIKEVNYQRELAGLSPLIKDSAAMEFSKEHCKWMKENGFAHSNDEVYGECILQAFLWSKTSYELAAKSAVKSWMESPPHRKILMGNFKYCGAYRIIYPDKNILVGYSTREVFTIKW